MRVEVAEVIRSATRSFSDASAIVAEGRVDCVSGMLVEVVGLNGHLVVGSRVRLSPPGKPAVEAEVVGFRSERAKLLAFGPVEGIGPGTAASIRLASSSTITAPPASVNPSTSWLGRVINPLGQPLDGKGMPRAGRAQPLRTTPPPAAGRARLGPRLSLGVRALDLFVTCRTGQRLGLFAGSGVGKSTLLAMLAQQADCDVAVIALVGERGREVREFIEDDLGPHGLARSVVVIATSDEPPMMRREAAYTALAAAEYFRDQGKSVLLMMDSVTRFCLALREIGLSAGEPPATRGYPPSVFAELPRLLERAGPGPDRGEQTGHITGLFTVLVDGDDHNEPVADAVRGILDGHVVLDRQIGEAGRYPAVDVLRSLSRTVPGCNSLEENALTQHARRTLATAAELRDLVRLGAYRAGADPDADEALRLAPLVEAVLRQPKHERATLNQAFESLRTAMGSTNGA